MPNSNPNRPSASAWPDDLSTAQLEELLRLEAAVPDADWTPGGPLDQLLNLLEARYQSDPAAGLSDPDRAWHTFQTRYHTPEGRRRVLFDDSLPASSEASSAPSEQLVRPRRRRHILLAAALAALSLLVLCAFGFNNLMGIGIWADGRFTFQDASETDQPLALTDHTDSGSYPSLEAALEAYEIEDCLPLPTIPERFSLINVTVYATPERPAELSFFATYSYRSATGYDYLTFSMRTSNTLTSAIYDMSEDAPVVYESGGVPFYIMRSGSQYTTAYRVARWEYCICGDITLEESKSMADSIYSASF